MCLQEHQDDSHRLVDETLREIANIIYARNIRSIYFLEFNHVLFIDRRRE